MAVTLEHTNLYVTDMAIAELHVRTIVRSMGLRLRERVLLLFKHFTMLPSNVGSDYRYLSEHDPEINELANALTYAHVLASERVVKHFRSETVALGVRYSRGRGTYNAVNQSTVQYLKRIYRSKAIEIVEGLNSRANKVLRQVITDGLKRGLNEQRLARNLGLAFNRLGITGQTRYTIATIARTQAQLAFNAGKWNAEQSPEVQDALWGYTYQTVGDDKVRFEHEMIDGVTLPKHYKFWELNYPPNGYNCRCQAIALFEEERHRRPPREYLGPDKDFEFNAGKVFSGLQ